MSGRVVQLKSGKYTENFLEENKLRVMFYEFFKNGFSYPNKDVYRILKEPLLKKIISEEAFSFLEELPPIDELQVTYTTYFDVVFGGKGCHLREGEYLKNKMSISKLLLECKSFYKNFGLYLQPNELPDSLEIELEFMYYLTYLIVDNYGKEGASQKLTEILKAQKDFLERHLINFISSLKECLKQYKELKFYYDLCCFLDDFLSYDLDFVDMALGKAS